MSSSPLAEHAPSPRTVLVFTAAAGGGHIAASKVIKSMLEAQGHRTVVLDGLSLMSKRLRWLQVEFYAWQLEHIGWSYGLAFRALGYAWVVTLNRYLIGRLWGNKLLDAITREQPDIVISTFPTVTAGLGRLVKNGSLTCPVIAVVTDYGVHPMWVSPEIDLHLVLSEQSRLQSEAAGGRAAIMRYPVDPRFARGHALPAARAELDLPDDALICLIIGGAWGVGNIEDAAAQVVAAGAFPVVVAGRNEELRSRLTERYPDPATARILGWTDQIPRLMAAANCLVQNAGGVTCLEAMEVGLPIVFYRPIPGHGRMNAAMMEAAGAAVSVSGPAEFQELLHRARRDPSVLPSPRREPGIEVMPSILAERTRPVRANLPPARPKPAPHRPLRSGLAVALTLLVLWFSLSSPGTLLTARALGHPVVDHPPQQGQVIIAVRATDPTVAGAVQSWIASSPSPVTLFVDASAATGLTRQTTGTIGLALPDHRRNPVDAGRNWVDERRAAKIVRKMTGISPSYVLFDGGKVRFSSILTSPEDATLIVGTSSEEADESSGIIVVDTDGMTPGQAIAQIEAAVGQSCDDSTVCVGLMPHATHDAAST